MNGQKRLIEKNNIRARQLRIILKLKPACMQKKIPKRWIVCLGTVLDIQLNFKVFCVLTEAYTRLTRGCRALNISYKKRLEMSRCFMTIYQGGSGHWTVNYNSLQNCINTSFCLLA